MQVLCLPTTILCTLNTLQITNIIGIYNILNSSIAVTLFIPTYYSIYLPVEIPVLQVPLRDDFQSVKPTSNKPAPVYGNGTLCVRSIILYRYIQCDKWKGMQTTNVTSSRLTVFRFVLYVVRGGSSGLRYIYAYSAYNSIRYIVHLYLPIWQMHMHARTHTRLAAAEELGMQF